MNLVLAIVGGSSIAFLVRFLVALRKEGRSVSSRPVNVSHLGQEQPPDREKVVMMNPGRLNRTRKSTIGRRVVMIILATVLVFLGHSLAQTSELPASAQEGRELRELVQQLETKVAQLEAQQTKRTQDATLQQVSAGNESARQASPPERTVGEQQAAPEGPPAQPADPAWHYGGFLDFGYLKDFNDPENHLFRSRGTTFHVNEWDVNMGAIYLRKMASEGSRWGTELTLQAGKDTQVFGFSATAPNLPGSNWLRHLGPTNFSYLAPVGKGLTLQGGIFSSFIGYDSLYAKDNFTCTRPWGADFTPYFMLGVNASYPFTNKLTGTLFVVNGYWHLADANSVPSSGGQFAYKPTDHLTLKQTVLYGPHQSNTSLEFWRFLSDSIVERKGDRITTAFEYIVGTEKIAAPTNPRALWMASQLPVHWALSRRFSMTVRPEVFWDHDGRTTGFSQTVKANTTTLEYRIPYRQASAILRLEHRIDDSRGPGGGFFNEGEVRPGVVGLTPTQNLLAFGVILTFESSFRH